MFFVPSRYSYGGVQLALGLRLMDNIDFSRAQHWTLSADSLVKMIDIYRNVMASWVYDRDQLADPKLVEKHLSPTETTELWRQMSEVWDAAPAPRATGSHSYHVVVADDKGNIATGTNTIESLNFTSDPIFVGGIPLNDTGRIAVPGPNGAFIWNP
jgi:gamma-glutamyltranspeptidase